MVYKKAALLTYGVDDIVDFEDRTNRLRRQLDDVWGHQGRLENILVLHGRDHATFHVDTGSLVAILQKKGS